VCDRREWSFWKTMIPYAFKDLKCTHVSQLTESFPLQICIPLQHTFAYQNVAFNSDLALVNYYQYYAWLYWNYIMIILVLFNLINITSLTCSPLVYWWNSQGVVDLKKPSDLPNRDVSVMGSKWQMRFKLDWVY
jgi:hypothetical protein